MEEASLPKLGIPIPTPKRTAPTTGSVNVLLCTIGTHTSSLSSGFGESVPLGCDRGSSGLGALGALMTPNAPDVPDVPDATPAVPLVPLNDAQFSTK